MARTPPLGSVTRACVVACARQWIGTPYHHQAAVRGVGTDCLGLVRGIWSELLGSAPEARVAYSRDWAEATGEETLLQAARQHLAPPRSERIEPGNLLVFRFREAYPAKHLAVMTGTEIMIHAIDGHAVAEVPLVAWWRRRIAARFDFPGLED